MAQPQPSLKILLLLTAQTQRLLPRPLRSRHRCCTASSLSSLLFAFDPSFQVSDVLSPCIDGPKRIASKRRRVLDVTATHADFIEALARLLRRYREFLLVLDPGADDEGVLPFRDVDWLASLEENEVAFCQQLCKTQVKQCCSI